VLEDVAIEEVVPYIDWNPFFQVAGWEGRDAGACLPACCCWGCWR
jgi:cobalamin-dependent methionine synthase I